METAIMAYALFVAAVVIILAAIVLGVILGAIVSRRR